MLHLIVLDACTPIFNGNSTDIYVFNYNKFEEV